MMTPRTLALAAGFALALVVGCTSVQSSGKTVYTLKRNLNAWETVLAVPIEKVHKATLSGLSDLSLKPITSRVDKLTGLVDGTMADGSDFEIRLEAMGDSVTRLQVRCGMLGDGVRSAHLFRAIEKRL